MSRITNRRWAMSAFGTASSAALTEADTVYSVTPPYHPSGLMMAIGGAIAGGSRLAMATEFNPETFWEEVRRYGVTVASYTWTLLHDIVEAPPVPGERHHPVRLFIGSGMPRGLWRRVERRFAPAKVLEFYASTEAAAILVNLRDVKPGSMGRRLPGSADVRIASYDVDVGGLEFGPDGFARECAVNEVGLLLARVSPTEQLSVTPLRGVFAREDAWLATPDLFRRDADGDYWRVDGLSDVDPDARRPGLHGADPRRAVRHPGGRSRGRLRGGSGQGRGRDPRGSGHIESRAGAERKGPVGARCPGLAVHARPAVVHVVDEIPVTTWYRPITAPLREAGVPQPSDAPPGVVPGRIRSLVPAADATARRRLTKRAA